MWNECFLYFHLIVSFKYLEIMILTVFHPIFISDLCTCLPFFICDSSSVPLSFIYGSVHYTENIKGIRTWKMPYGINNIFHKLQEKNTLAFSNWTLQIKSLMKSAHAKHFQKLVRYNSYLGPLITSPPQITVFTLYVIHALSTGTYNYKFYAYYWSLYKIQVLSWHVQWHYLYFNRMWVVFFL